MDRITSGLPTEMLRDFFSFGFVSSLRSLILSGALCSSAMSYTELTKDLKGMYLSSHEANNNATKPCAIAPPVVSVRDPACPSFCSDRRVQDMLTTNTILIALIPLLYAILYLPTATENALNLPSLNKENILLLTAHPDDECLFFAPTIISLLPFVQIHVLSLSTGNADGLGDIRRKELMESLEMLGVKEENRHIVDNSYVYWTLYWFLFLTVRQRTPG